jgi:glucose/arabinose dehydrogenase
MVRLGWLLVLVACGDNKHPPPEPEPFVRCETPTFGTTVEMEPLTQVANPVMLVTSPPRDYRLFIVEQTGAIRIFEGGVLLPAPFIDLSADAGGQVISDLGELGLLGLAFHPQYGANGQFFVTYTAVNFGDPDNRLRDVLARCTVSQTDPNRAELASCVDVLSIPDYASNHNGGMIEFGPDGLLYWGTGDGGGRNDPNFNGQNTHALLGKMLRLDVDRKAPGKEYGIPRDNPFASGGGGAPEIFMIGLRNPWRWSFDRMTGDMWIADVGQHDIEELDVLRRSKQRGANLGWNTYEGSRCFVAETCTMPQIAPQDERLHSDGWVSIIGGQVYRGSCFPDLQGTYFYTDWDDRGRLSTAKLRDDDTLEIVDLPGTFPPRGASLHEDAAGELYETTTDGLIYQLVVR